MSVLWHCIVHKLGWNMGRVVSVETSIGHQIGFQCCDCGEIEGIHWPFGKEPSVG